ncbi:hypothetical protein BH23ACT6_BH23ACT6_12150 [soil metagenome]
MNTVAPQSRPLLPIASHTVGRSAMTCRYRCGDACFGEIPNTSDNAYFGDIVSKSPSRRTMLKAGGVGATMGLLAAWGVAEPDPSNAAVAGKRRPPSRYAAPFTPR